LARLASEGMTFSNAYAAAGMCAPARCSLQTGMSAARTRFSGNGGFGEKCPTTVEYDMRSKSKHRAMLEPVPWGSLQANHPTIAERIKPLGYATAHFGKWHVYGGGPGKRGYDAHDGETSNDEGNSDNPEDPKNIFSMTKSAVNFIDQQAAKGKPFYVQLSHYAEHNAVQSRPATQKAVESDARIKPLQPSVRKQVVGRTSMMEDLDTSVGMVLDKLQALGIRDNTYVIYTSDNGHHRENGRPQPLRGDKWWLWECGIRVPMIVTGPGVTKGSRCNVNVIAYDFLPTIVDVAGGDAVESIDGRSLLPVFHGDPDIGPLASRSLYFHYPHHRNTAMHSAIIKGKDKLMVFYERPGERFLYDLQRDIGERQNVAKSFPEKAARLHQELNTYLSSVEACMPKPNPEAAADYVPYSPDLHDESSTKTKTNKKTEK
jgi:arylsulfatase A-like enzyme